jgi:hypothetical protein
MPKGVYKRKKRKITNTVRKGWKKAGIVTATYTFPDGSAAENAAKTINRSVRSALEDLKTQKEAEIAEINKMLDQLSVKG